MNLLIAEARCPVLYRYSANVGMCLRLYDINSYITSYGSVSDTCEKDGATIVRIDSKEKQDAVEEYMGKTCIKHKNCMKECYCLKKR